MNKLSNCLIDLIELSARHLGYDIFIEGMSLKQGPLNFVCENNGVDKEWWGVDCKSV